MSLRSPSSRCWVSWTCDRACWSCWRAAARSDCRACELGLRSARARPSWRRSRRAPPAPAPRCPWSGREGCGRAPRSRCPGTGSATGTRSGSAGRRSRSSSGSRSSRRAGSSRRSPPVAARSTLSERFSRTRRTTSRSFACFSWASLLVAARPGRSPGGCAGSPPRRAAGRADRRNAGSWSTTRPLATSRARAAPSSGRAGTGGPGPGAPAATVSAAAIASHGGQRDQRQAAIGDGSTVGRCSSVPRWPTGLADGLARRSRAWRVGPSGPWTFRPWGSWFPRSTRSGRVDSAQCARQGIRTSAFASSR